MTTKTWNNSVDVYTDASAWSPTGVPQPGDTVVVNGGALTAAGLTLDGIALQVNGPSSGNEFSLTDSTLTGTSSLTTSNSSGDLGSPLTLSMLGRVANQGQLHLTAGKVQINLGTDGQGTAGTLVNTGTIDVQGNAYFRSTDAGGDTVQNSGMIANWKLSSNLEQLLFSANLTGSGVVQVNPNSGVALSGSVAAGQLIDFTGANGNPANTAIGAFVQINQATTFQGTINGFTTGDTLEVTGGPYSSFTYASTGANTGTLSLLSGSTVVTSLNFDGAYSQSSFNVTNLGQNQATVNITTTAAPPQDFHFTNAALNQSSTDTGVAYTGPVAGLDRQYIWNSSDPVAISASVPNVFLKGGAGGDALVVSGGTNVLDGGGGSNFLVGGTGADSHDTFFVDGRGGVVTWSTISNFHLGDQATIFGFQNGVSTMPFTASDGTSGYQGFTIHSELNGAGTGVNESVTFSGITQDQAQAHFTFTTGTLGSGASATNYLLISYDH